MDHGEAEDVRPATAFRVTYFADIPRDHHKAHVVDGLLGAGELTAWYGYPGSGKSAAVADAGAHVAAGMPWFGRDVTQGAVVYVAAERAGLVRRRLRAWGKHHEIDDIALAVVDGSFDFFCSHGHADEIIRIGIKLAEDYETQVGWVIVDTKAMVMGGGDPNGDTDIVALGANLRRIISGLGTPHMSIVDHVPYSSPERIKGSGALPGLLDGSLLVRKEGNAHTISIGSKPFNDGPDDFAIAFTMKTVEIGVDDAGKATTAPVIIPSDAEPAAGRGRSLKPAGQKVMGAFGRLFDEGKTYPAPPVPGVSPETRAVMMTDLRDMALSLGIFPLPEPTDVAERGRWRNGRNQAWKRGLQEVQNAGLLRLEADLVWNPYQRCPVTENGDSR